LLTIHFAAAKFCECPELQLANEEAATLAVAIQKVNEQYNATMSPKVLAWMQLAMVSGSIYGTRIYAIRARTLAAQPARPAAGQHPNVVNFKPAAPGPEAKVKPNGAAAETEQPRTPADLFGLNYSAAIQHDV
jgi:hypothetical protein